jgi:hypothetical protein
MEKNKFEKFSVLNSGGTMGMGDAMEGQMEYCGLGLWYLFVYQSINQSLTPCYRCYSAVRGSGIFGRDNYQYPTSRFT